MHKPTSKDSGFDNKQEQSAVHSSVVDTQTEHQEHDTNVSTTVVIALPKTKNIVTNVHEEKCDSSSSNQSFCITENMAIFFNLPYEF